MDHPNARVDQKYILELTASDTADKK